MLREDVHLRIVVDVIKDTVPKGGDRQQARSWSDLPQDSILLAAVVVCYIWRSHDLHKWCHRERVLYVSDL